MIPAYIDEHGWTVHFIVLLSHLLGPGSLVVRRHLEHVAEEGDAFGSRRELVFSVPLKITP